MHAEHKDWQNGWHGISLGLSVAEIDRLVEMLAAIRDDPDQHFHLSSTFKGSGGIGDIEVYALPEGAAHNMTISSVALPPGSIVDD